ncbi:tRNA dihydrouridine(20/20a) synthase DusA [Thiomicrorhabdus sp. zzn3]|uniref:tRNA dihydrouridine(20/20a) synthase DusA n=1 Tax=Thiomicrorhabdus sp. zzn3 TaxID=3039775 RepID=UPI002436A364|nr:tRNA dihydrouridine(20/20a) synthase DusA [Thiomicrorhabdus sp. zzn3]MDG6778046.1 tRNA dihydrouridine(20/20a) synthase DusA [Thiomicrorhabdus sp. zzn3]
MSETIQASKHPLSSASQFSVAPMLDWTDRHCRYFHRQLSQQAWLYSEMVTTGALIYGNNLPRFLGHHPDEAPVVLQLGGSAPKELAQCAQLGEEWGYTEINLNVGCPSDRVQNNMIGACLMGHPELVAENVNEMKAATKLPVTVKCRIGIDDQESFDSLYQFSAGLVEAGVDGLIIHARKAWLQGLSPKENREIPPLHYDWVHRIKAEFPDLPIAVNGGITSPQEGLRHRQTYEGLPAVDGVMLGRAIYERPYLLSEVDALYYNRPTTVPSREEIVAKMLPYIENHLSSGGKLIQVTRHMLGLFHGLPGGRMWRRHLSQNAFKATAGIDVVEQALKLVEDELQRMQERQAQEE